MSETEQTALQHPGLAGMRGPMTIADLRALLRAECHKAGGQAAWIRAQTMFHFSRSTICEVLAGKHEPSDNLLAALGLRRAVTYERVE